MNLQPICEICHHVCVIPVKITCFPCSKTDKVHCHSLKRFCQSCVETYLELDKLEDERSQIKQCMYCMDVVNPRYLTARTSYEKDFLTMSFDFSFYKCIHKECSYVGTQIFLNRHLENECMYSIKTCECCHLPILSKDVDSHIEECEGYIVCKVCCKLILTCNYSQHLSSQHLLSECCYCETLMDEYKHQHHIIYDCQYRPKKCKYCHSFYSLECVHTDIDPSSNIVVEENRK